MFRYRFPPRAKGGGKQCDLGLGTPAKYNLETVRGIVAEYWRMIERGEDPMARRQAAAAAHESKRTYKVRGAVVGVRAQQCRAVCKRLVGEVAVQSPHLPQAQEAVSPGYGERVHQRMQREQTGTWWDPGDTAPQRAPDYGAAVGQPTQP